MLPELRELLLQENESQGACHRMSLTTECLTLAARSITAEEKLLVFFTARPVDSTAFAIPRVLRAGVQGC